MTPPATPQRYKNHRFPAEIINHGVWLYYRFCLSYRDVEELLSARGIVVSYEAIRKWCRKFGQDYANQLRRRRPQPGDKWHLDGCCQAGNTPWRGASAAPLFEQPRRKLPPADAPARAAHAGVQIAGSCAAVPLRVWTDRPTLPTETPPAPCPRISPSHGPTVSDLARSHGDCSSIKGPIPMGGYTFLPDEQLSTQ
jgi:hypothetical protein